MNKFFQEPKKYFEIEQNRLQKYEEMHYSHKYPIYAIDNDIYYNIMYNSRIPLCVVCMQKVIDYSYSVNNLDDLVNFPVCKKHDTFLNKNMFPIIWQVLESEWITEIEVLNSEKIFKLLRNNHILTSRLKKLMKHEVASFGYCDFEYTLYLLKKTNLEGILK